MQIKKYRVIITQSGKFDIKEKKKYILLNFKYREYAENFSRTTKEAIKSLDICPYGYDTTGFQYRGYDIYMKPANNYLIFYVVDEAKMEVAVLRVLQDGMDWEQIIKMWLKRNKNK